MTPDDHFYRLIEQIQELGWSCSKPIHPLDPKCPRKRPFWSQDITNPGEYIVGGTGPKKDGCYTGVCFIIRVRQGQFDVRLAGPGQLTTETTVDTPAQVIAWMKAISPALRSSSGVIPEVHGS